MSPSDRWTVPLSVVAHVESSGPARPESVLIAFHGYGETPQKLLELFAAAGITDRSLVVAPWGLHHYYDRKGEVVASWLTRFERECRIEELRRHSLRIWEEIRRRHGELPLALFGFSQGAANVYRVGLLPELPARALYVLGGDMPPETVSELAAAPRRPVHLLWGEGDEVVPIERMEADAARLAAAGFPLARTVVKGGHALLPSLLLEVRQGLRRLP
jgi:predicted esterase